MGHGRHASRVAILLGALALLLATAVSAQAATRYAEPGGKGPAGKCPKSNPCDIQDAVELAAVKDGDKVVLAGGTYSTEANELVVEKDVTISGSNKLPSSRILAAGGGFAVRVVSPGAELRDIQIEQSGGSAGLALLSGSADRMTVSSSGTGACTAIGDSVLRNSFCLGTDGAAGFALLAGGTFNFSPKLRGVTAVAADPGPNAYGVQLGIGDGGVAKLDAVGVIASGPAGDVHAETAGPGNTATVSLDHSNFSTVSIDGAGASITPPTEAGNQSEEPNLVNVGKGDLHQRASSPTVDAGIATDLGALDIDNEKRVQGEAPDIGADEVDSEVEGAKLKAKGTQAQHGSTVRVDLTAGAKEPVQLRAKGTVVVGSQTFALSKASIGAQKKPKKIQLQLERSDARKTLAAIEKGAAAEAKLTVGFTDRDGNTTSLKRTVKLK